VEGSVCGQAFLSARAAAIPDALRMSLEHSLQI
jgi:hypothetical protein